MDIHRTGLMVLRVWVEEGSERPLRVDVRQTSDPALGFRGERTLTDVDHVLAVVRRFLESGGSNAPVVPEGD
ncbi:hypothetical protein PWG71_28230 [Nocardiopsis sp. N85]|uniref:hypothetical protein n=1 Tax=Nocardiopsis sp. N85 TaxID=3029400 RepID=UPI00237F5744|nr:hypothetical protein [Nocardiopsis sp. N85]MDE3725286.1 hypothetical protein [Nocardiopsis sp. N85]